MVISIRMTTLALSVSAVACAPHTVGTVSAVAAPIPILVGPVGCIGTCATPTAKVPYGDDLVVVTGVETTTTTQSTQTTTLGRETTTTTKTSAVRGAGTNAVYPFLLPMLRMPFSKRSVAQLDVLEMGRRYDTTTQYGGATTATTTLTMGGKGYFYGLPAPAAEAAPTNAQPPPAPPPPPPSPDTDAKKRRSRS